MDQVFDILKYDKTTEKNDLGQYIASYIPNGSFKGWLDMLGGNETIDQKAITANSTHVIVTPEINAQVTIADHVIYNGQVYEVTFVDDPVNINHHLEIYLKKVV